MDHYYRSSRLLAVIGICAIACSSVVGAPPRAHADEGGNPEVIGGHNAANGAWPFMASLVEAGQEPSDPGRGHFCGGVLVAPNYVVTAAHCVEFLTDEPSRIDVVVGRTVLSSSEGYRSNVAGIVLHPQYDYLILRNDVALLRLASPIPLTPAQLVRADEERLFNNGADATIIGWGTIDPEFAVLPDNLQQGETRVRSDAQCRANLGLLFSPQHHLCAGTLATSQQPGVSTCYGDSGGPLMVIDPDGQHKVAGLTSFGFECASPRFYNVFTRISRYFDWIMSFPPTPPSNTEFPSIAWLGDPLVGTTFSCAPGTWRGDDLEYRYQWSTGADPFTIGEPIAGATSSTYLADSSVVGRYLFCTVTARNRSGSLDALSYGVGPVTNPVIIVNDFTPPSVRIRRATCRAKRCTIDVRATDTQSAVTSVEGALSFEPSCSGRRCAAAARHEFLNATDLGDSLWRFSFRVRTAGRATLAARATDAKGNISTRLARATVRVTGRS